MFVALCMPYGLGVKQLEAIWVIPGNFPFYNSALIYKQNRPTAFSTRRNSQYKCSNATLPWKK